MLSLCWHRRSRRITRLFRIRFLESRDTLDVRPNWCGKSLRKCSAKAVQQTHQGHVSRGMGAGTSTAMTGLLWLVSAGIFSSMQRGRHIVRPK